LVALRTKNASHRYLKKRILALLEETQKEAQKPVTNTTLTCVIKGVPTNLEVNDQTLHLKQKGLPVTNVRRIVNDRGPLPLLRVFTRDPNIFSYLITNGISIGYNRYKAEESRTRGRPLPCRTCLTYHAEKKCFKTPACYICEEAHQSYTCRNTPNKNYCGTCGKRSPNCRV